MSIYGRRSVPGEKSVRDQADQRNVLNRTIRAQVTSVNHENGYVLITYESMPGGGKYATVPPLWMSFPEANIGGPAWGRYMPQQSDLIKVSFDYDDRPHVIGYDIVAGKVGVANNTFGWPQLHDQYKAGQSSSDPKKAKFAQFTPLNPGEYDFMSSGGAYIYGNNRGRLYLAGGSVSVALVKNDLRINQRAQLWYHVADDCELRFGQVRRVVTSDGLETAIGDKKQMEFNLMMKNTVSAGSSTNLSSLKVGNVRSNSDGAEENTPSAGSALRFSYKSYNDSGEETLHNAIDKLGNWEVIAPNADKGVVFDFSSSDWIAGFTNIKFEASELCQLKSKDCEITASNSLTIKSNTTEHTADSSYRLKSPIQTFEASTSFFADSPKILLGNGAGHGLILSNTYLPAESTCLGQLVAHINAHQQALKSIAKILNAGGAASTVPIAGAIAMGKIHQAGAIALEVALAIVENASTTALNQFNSGSYKSENTYTK